MTNKNKNSTESVQQSIQLPTNGEALAVIQNEEGKHQLVLIGFNKENLKVTEEIKIIETDTHISEIRERFRIEAAKRDFV